MPGPSPAGLAADFAASPPSYDRAYTGRGAWWRLVVTLLASGVAVVAGAVAALFLVTYGARLIGFDDFEIDPDDGINAGEMLATNLGLVALIPIAALFSRLLYGVRFDRLTSVRPGLRAWWLWACMGMALVVWLPLFVLILAGVFATGDALIGGAFVGFLVVVLLTTPAQAAGEEYLFRGLLMQAFGAVRAPAWVGIVVTGVLFATAHLQFQLPLFLDRMLLGCVLAYLVMRTGGLEAAIAVHAIKNLIALIPAGLLGDVDEALDPGSVNWIPLVVDVVMLSIIVPWIVSRWRRRERLEAQAAPPPLTT